MIRPRLPRNLDIGFDDDRDLLDIAGVDLFLQIIESHGAGSVSLLDLLGRRSLLSDHSRIFIIVEDLEVVSGDRNIIQTDDLDRCGRFGFLDLPAGVICHLTDLAVCRSDDDGITLMERSVLY